MRTVGVWMLGGLLLIGGSRAAAQDLKFDGETYSRAFSDDSHETNTYEYVRAGETLENWKRLIGIRHFRAAKTLRDVLPSYLEQIGPALVRKPEILRRDGTDEVEEVLLILHLAPPDRSYIELNFHRFVELKDGRGVVAYQFAYKHRLDREDAAEQLREFTREHQQDWLRELGSLKLRLPEVANEEAANN